MSEDPVTLTKAELEAVITISAAITLSSGLTNFRMSPVAALDHAEKNLAEANMLTDANKKAITLIREYFKEQQEEYRRAVLQAHGVA